MGPFLHLGEKHLSVFHLTCLLKPSAQIVVKEGKVCHTLKLGHQIVKG